jgi:hypothetical protein
MIRATLGGRLLLLLGTALLGAGCRSQSDESKAADEEGGRVVSVSLDKPPTEEQKTTMLAAKDVLFEKLSGRLMEVMRKDGPVAAIGVCKSEASELAKSIGEQEGVKIGRTSLKLRNPDNTPPQWAESLMDAERDQATFLTFSDGRAAALLAIKLKAQCLMCHGPVDQILPEIKTQLATLYPVDNATGFNEGDLRGWFWVETLE